MRSSATTSQAGRSSKPQRAAPRRTLLVVAAVILVLVVTGFVHVVHGGDAGLKLCAKKGWALGDTFVDLDDYGDRTVSNSDGSKVLVAMFACGALRRPVHADAEPGGELARQRGPSPTEQSRVPRPALPEAPPAEPTPAEPRSTGYASPEAKRKLTEIKVQKYAHEAYPAWLRAHPGQMCPHQLIELNEFMGDSDANDAWGRPLKMSCSTARPAGEKRLRVFSLGRDAEKGTEDDIKAEE
jgi:hypothetical protein